MKCICANMEQPRAANLEKYPIKDGCSVFAGTVLGVRVALNSLNAWNRLASSDCPVILCTRQGDAEFQKNPGLFCSVPKQLSCGGTQ